MKLFVGGLPFKYTGNELKELFSSYGEITEAVIITDRQTGRSKGFGFVTFTDDEAANKAISEMNGKDIEGRKITVNEARPMEARSERPRSSFQSRGRY